MEQGLDCVINKDIKAVILGTFPSIKSRHECYYNHEKNLFWPIIAITLNNSKPLITKEERYNCLLKNHIGLWDVIKQCEFETKSSLDSKIIKESIIFNDFNVLRENCPHLKFILFSSRNAEILFKRYMRQLSENSLLKQWLIDSITYIVLPSTSPANARLKAEEKLRLWQEILYNIKKSINPQTS